MDITKVKEQLGYRDVVPFEKGMELTVRWYLENTPEPGGWLETNIMDPFDYATEDKIIRQLKNTLEQLQQLPGIDYSWSHPYHHPKSHGDLR